MGCYLLNKINLKKWGAALRKNVFKKEKDLFSQGWTWLTPPKQAGGAEAQNRRKV